VIASTDYQTESPIVVERVRMPDNPKAGRYNASGKEDANGSVFVLRVGPSAHVWAVLEHNPKPGDRCAMIFENIRGTGMLDVIMSQWIKGGSGDLGENFNQPYIGEAVVVHLARYRARDAVKVVGLNSSTAEISVAAGVLFVPGSGA
jgi:hypothetical protein